MRGGEHQIARQRRAGAQVAARIHDHHDRPRRPAGGRRRIAGDRAAGAQSISQTRAERTRGMPGENNTYLLTSVLAPIWHANWFKHVSRRRGYQRFLRLPTLVLARGFFFAGFDAGSLDHHFAGYWIGEPEPVALVFEMLTERIENADHEWPRVNDLLEARPFANEAKRAFAGSDQRPAAEALETGVHASVLRNELILMARLDAEPHDIECRHVVLPTVKV